VPPGNTNRLVVAGSYSNHSSPWQSTAGCDCDHPKTARQRDGEYEPVVGGASVFETRKMRQRNTLAMVLKSGRSHFRKVSLPPP
jgi:hypothetical protein